MGIYIGMGMKAHYIAADIYSLYTVLLSCGQLTKHQTSCAVNRVIQTVVLCLFEVGDLCVVAYN